MTPDSSFAFSRFELAHPKHEGFGLDVTLGGLYYVLYQVLSVAVKSRARLLWMNLLIGCSLFEVRLDNTIHK